MQENLGKSLIKIIAITMLSMIVLTSIVGILMYCVFTRNMADFMYNLGCDKVASCLYYKSYEKSDNIADCYKALNIKIKLNEYNKVIEYYEDFENNEEFEKFINSNKVHCEKLNVSILEKSTLLNDIDYLKKNYVRALISERQLDKAKNIAISDFVNLNTSTINNQGVYSLGLFIDNVEMFEETYEGLDKTLIEEMQEYFNKISELFNSNTGVVENSAKAYLVALGNRIINVGQDLNSLYNKLNRNEDLKNNNTNTMINVNNIIKGTI